MGVQNKMPCDNNLNIEPAGNVIDNINLGGDAMNKFLVNNSSLANTIEVAVDVSKSIDVSELTEALGAVDAICDKSTNTRHPHILFSRFILGKFFFIFP